MILLLLKDGQNQADDFLREKIRDLIGIDLKLLADDLVNIVQENFKNDQIAGLKAWGHIITILGSDLHRTQNLNLMLNLIELAFNSDQSCIRTSAFKGWRRLILSFVHKG